jgi:choline dehydrogenase-like flavoprotein
VAVVGAGSAGCAVAARLASTTGFTVALIEAGPDYGPFSEGRWPTELLDPRLSVSTHDWGYVRHVRGLPDGRPYSRAKVFGGCSAHNQCAAVWPFPQDFDQWALSGLGGWGFDKLRPLINTVDLEVPRSSQTESQLGAWQKCFLDAAFAAGYAHLEDLSSPEPPVGAMPFHMNVLHGVRWNSAFNFIDRERDQSKVALFPNTMVERVVLDGDEARGLVCRSESSEPIALEANRIVIAAGAIGSPLLLMRSGVGPPDDLKSAEVDCRVDLPGVGGNLHDHHGVSVTLEPTGTALEAVRKDQAIGEPIQSQVILRERSSRSVLPDLHVLPAGTRPDQTIVNVMVMNMAPRSRGRVKPSGPGPLDPPLIDFAFLAHQEDVDVVLEGVEKVRRLSGLGLEIAPGRHADSEAWVRNNATSYAHAAGTCRMGRRPADGAVVDAEGRIHGLENVWIADASVIPTLPMANTNLVCYLIGFRMAEVIAGRLPGRGWGHSEAVV